MNGWSTISIYIFFFGGGGGAGGQGWKGALSSSWTLSPENKLTFKFIV